MNEEAALRNEEALAMHQELDVIRSERDNLATEIENLKAQLLVFQKRENENLQAADELRRIQQKGLDGADEAIKMRDTIIRDLAGRLDQALGTLELEREQQRQRRQIIFPAARDGRFWDELDNELRSTKDALRESQQAMDLQRREFEEKEAAWMLKIENLERQLSLRSSN